MTAKMGMNRRTFLIYRREWLSDWIKTDMSLRARIRNRLRISGKIPSSRRWRMYGGMWTRRKRLRLTGKKRNCGMCWRNVTGSVRRLPGVRFWKIWSGITGLWFVKIRRKKRRCRRNLVLMLLIRTFVRLSLVCRWWTACVTVSWIRLWRPVWNLTWSGLRMVNIRLKIIWKRWWISWTMVLIMRKRILLR